jgi:hypothetical protein
LSRYRPHFKAFRTRSLEGESVVTHFVRTLAVAILLGGNSFTGLADDLAPIGTFGLGLHLGNVSEQLEIGSDFELNLDIGATGFATGHRYGMAHVRLMIGNTFGINLSDSVGWNFFGDSPFILSTELLNFQINWAVQAAAEQRNYFEWTPMAAAGFQVQTDQCRVVAVIRGGGSVGTLGDGGARPAYGVGGYVDCESKLALGAELLRIEDASNDIDLARVEISVPIGAVGDELIHAINARYEALVEHGNAQAAFFFEDVGRDDHEEHRVIIMYTLQAR